MRYSIKHLLKHLTYKEFLGYYFEDYCKRALEPWIREATPDNPVEWKRWLGRGADIKLKDNTEIECKYVESYVYASAVLRHVLPRFTANATEKIVLTNNKRRWTRKARELLELNNIQLRTIDEEVERRLGNGYCILVEGLEMQKDYSCYNLSSPSMCYNSVNCISPSPEPYKTRLRALLFDHSLFVVFKSLVKTLKELLKAGRSYVKGFKIIQSQKPHNIGNEKWNSK